MDGARKNMCYPVEETAAKHERIVNGDLRTKRGRSGEGRRLFAWRLQCPFRFEGKAASGCRCTAGISTAKSASRQEIKPGRDARL
jgi:hypothetical protein